MHDSSVTPETLTDWLGSAGTLPRGTVTHICVESEYETFISKLVFLAVEYSADAPTNLPRRLVVKTPLIAPKFSVETSEVEFYRHIAPLIGTPPLPRCLAAMDSGVIVLEDLRATHDHPPWPLPPSRTNCELAMDALARVHAQWWEAPALGHTVGKPNTRESLTTMVQDIAAHLPAFIDAAGHAMTADALSVYERVFSSSLKPWLRLADQRALTLVHGDAHTWNFLFPRNGEGVAFLFDWQLWHVDVGARDLAFMMALHWYPSRRRELEVPLLRRYHEQLLAQGVRNYSFDDLWLDYRRCAVRNLTIPIIYWRRGMKPGNWWHRIECALAAYQDLDCDELL